MRICGILRPWFVGLLMVGLWASVTLAAAQRRHRRF